MESAKDSCLLNDFVAVRVSTTAGCWPAEDLFFEAKLETSIQEVLLKAAAALNLVVTNDYVVKHCNKVLEASNTFQKSGLRHLVELEFSKIEKGGGAHPLLSQEFFINETDKLTPTFTRIRNWKVLSNAYPELIIEMTSLDKDPIRVLCNCSDYPTTPPSYKFLDRNNSPLVNILGVNGGYINMSPHPVSHTAFICAPGAREYHTYDGHKNDLWDNYRTRLEDYGLIATLSKISNFFANGGNR
jgi:hypothetical protein